MSAEEQPERAQMISLPATPTAKAPTGRFTGDVWVDVITSGSGDSTATLAAVHFSPGVRTAWHCHANGQTLPSRKATASSGPKTAA